MSGFLRQEDGQAVVEYAVLVSFVSIAAIVLVQLLGLGVSGLFQTALDSLP